MSELRKLDLEAVKMIGSTEVVQSPVSVVKELVENALDAGSSRIAIRLENYGLTVVEVSDNGSGIPSHWINLLAHHHCTSKLVTKGVMEAGQVTTYGFRGEALASLAAVTGQLAISTCCSGEPIGRKYLFDFSSQSFSQPQSVAMQSGTIVTASNLFHRLPVRRDFYSKSKQRLKDVLNSTRRIVVALSLCRPSCRFSLRHSEPGGKAPGNVVWETAAGFTEQTMLALVGGPLVAASDFQRLEMCLSDDGSHTLLAFLPPGGISLEKQSLLMRTSTADCIFLSVNNRPVDDKAISTAIKSAYTESGLFSKTGYPICCVKITTPLHSVDANIDVTKQRVMFSIGQENIVNAVKKAIYQFLTTERPSMAREPDVTPDENLIQADEDEDLPKTKRKKTTVAEDEDSILEAPVVFTAEQWSKGQSKSGFAAQPVQIIPNYESPQLPAKSSWTLSVSQMREQHNRRHDKFTSDNNPQIEIPPSAPMTLELTVKNDLSHKLSIAASKYENKLRSKPLPTSFPEQLVTLCSTRSIQDKKMNPPPWKLENLQKSKNNFGPRVIGPLSRGSILALLMENVEDPAENLRQNVLFCCTRRLAESSLFASMLASVQLPRRNLGHTVSISRLLNAKQLEFIASLQAKPSTPPLYHSVLDNRLLANGFKLRVYKQTTGDCYVEVEQAPELPNDMLAANQVGCLAVEIIDLMMKSQSLTACRPPIIVEYFRNEVDRLLSMRQQVSSDQEAAFAGSSDLSFLHQQLTAAKNVNNLTCPHGKPLFYSLTSA